MFLHSFKNIIFHTTEDERLIKKAQQLQHDVFLEKGYIKHPFPNKIMPLPSYVKKSVYVVASKGSTVLGTLIISKVSSPSDVFRDWEIKNRKCQELLRKISQMRFAEVGRLAVKRKFRDQKISGGLYKACWLYALLKGIKWYLIKMDKEVFKSFQKFGWYSKIIAPPKFYMGSITVPAVIEIEKQLSHVYKKNFEFYKYLVS